MDGWKYLHGGKWKAKKKRKTENGDGDEDDFEDVVAQEAVQQRKHSLRRRRKVDYSAQLVESVTQTHAVRRRTTSHRTPNSLCPDLCVCHCV